MKLITSPEPLPAERLGVSVFLAGSIEQDKAVDWQKVAIQRFGSLPGVIFNPRRVAWDSSWGEDDPRFIEQVRWEFQAMKQADIIVMHFEPATLSPITLLELGRYSESGKLYVSCPPGFWRRGNVKFVCNDAGIHMHESLHEMLDVVFGVISSNEILQSNSLR